MIRIRTIHSAALPANRARLAQVTEIFRASFPSLGPYADDLPEILENPFERGYRAVIIDAETSLARILGFCLVLHFPQVHACWLDFIAVRSTARSRGIGSALYEAAREFCEGVDARALFLEVQPDAPSLTPDPDELAAARRRLRFYEHYGVRPVVNDAYPQPLGQPPSTALLLFDGLGLNEPLSREYARAAIGAILEKRFAHSADPEYVRSVREAFRDDPVRLRPPRYVRREIPVVHHGRLEKRFALAASQKHAIHHVRQRGYLERPARVGALLEALTPTGLFSETPVRHHGEAHIFAVHDRQFVNFLKTVCTRLSTQHPVYPDTFPIRRSDRRPRLYPEQAGYYCIDSCTPLDGNAYAAARVSVDVALSAAGEILAGKPVAYAICRPPGHHAERRVYGGFCYFNNAAIAAQQLAAFGKTAILDVDYHHGNGTQDIFYQRADVLTISIHGHPDTAFPYFSGFSDETGEGAGRGFNRNFPLPPGTEAPAWLNALDKALHHLHRFGPEFLVVSLGYDIIRGDPTGRFNLPPRTLETLAHHLATLKVPLLITQEGGYNLRNLRNGAHSFFTGLANALD